MENGGTHFTIPFDRQQLADYLGVDRSALSAEIGKLRREGVIDALRAAGAGEGSTVRIGEMEFDFVE